MARRNSYGRVTGARPTPALPARLGQQSVSLPERIAHELRCAILDGRIRPGDRLVEGRLAEQFGVSRIPVREALRALTSDGLLEFLPRRGAVVLDLSHESGCEMIEVRATLEGLSARLAARHRDSGVIGALNAVLERGKMAAADGRWEELAELNAQFHDVLATAGCNRFLGDLVRGMRERSRTLFRPRGAEHTRQLWEDHVATLAAIAAGDEDLAEMLALCHEFRAGADFLLSSGDGCAPCARGFSAGRRPEVCPYL